MIVIGAFGYVLEADQKVAVIAVAADTPCLLTVASAVPYSDLVNLVWDSVLVLHVTM